MTNALTTAWLAARLGEQPARVEARRRAGELVGVRREDGQHVYPGWQFGRDGKPHSQLASLIAAARAKGARRRAPARAADAPCRPRRRGRPADAVRAGDLGPRLPRGRRGLGSRPATGRRTTSASPSTATEPPSASTTRPATAAPKSRRLSPRARAARVLGHGRDADRGAVHGERHRSRPPWRTAHRASRASARSVASGSTAARPPVPVTSTVAISTRAAAPCASSSVSASRRAGSQRPDSIRATSRGRRAARRAGRTRPRSSGGSAGAAPRARSMRVSVRANPFTVASGVRRSWHASETSRAKLDLGHVR